MAILFRKPVTFSVLKYASQSVVMQTGKVRTIASTASVKYHLKTNTKLVQLPRQVPLPLSFFGNPFLSALTALRWQFLDTAR